MVNIGRIDSGLPNCLCTQRIFVLVMWIYLYTISKDRMQVISIGGADRYTGVLHQRKNWNSISHITKQITESSVILSGGEPTLREDLPQLLAEIRTKNCAIALRTDGAICLHPQQLDFLQQAGVSTYIIPIHSIRSDINAWLMGAQMAKIAIQGMIKAQEAGMNVIAEVLILRPTVPFLEETVIGLIKKGIKKILLRFPTPQDFAQDQVIALLPRYSLLAKHIENILFDPIVKNTRIYIENIPNCFLENGDIYGLYTKKQNNLKCFDCTGGCMGLDKSYPQTFDWSEFRISSLENTTSPDIIHCAIRQYDSSRYTRQRLLFAAQSHPKELHLISEYKHPQIYELLRETLRLSIPKIVLLGQVENLLHLSDKEIIRLRGIGGIVHNISLVMEDGISRIGTEMEWQTIEKLQQSFPNSTHIYRLVLHSMEELHVVNSIIEHSTITLQITLDLHGNWKELPGVWNQLHPNLQKMMDTMLPYCWHNNTQSAPVHLQWRGYAEKQNNYQESWLYPPLMSCPHKQCSMQKKCVGAIMGEGFPILRPM